MNNMIKHARIIKKDDVNFDKIFKIKKIDYENKEIFLNKFVYKLSDIQWIPNLKAIVSRRVLGIGDKIATEKEIQTIKFITDTYSVLYDFDIMSVGSLDKSWYVWIIPLIENLTPKGK
jgi:hypothetical protein